MPASWIEDCIFTWCIIMITVLALALCMTLLKGAAAEPIVFSCSLCGPRNVRTSKVDVPTMSFPERIIPDTLWTCREVDEAILFGLGLDDCKDAIEALPNNLILDLSAYCGCDETNVIPSARMIDQHCSFCTESTPKTTSPSSMAPSTYLSRFSPLVSPADDSEEPSSSPAPTSSTSPSVSSTSGGLNGALSSLRPSFRIDGNRPTGGIRRSAPDADPDTVFVDPCPDLFNIAPFVKDANYCDTIIKPMEEFCCQSKDTGTSCSICPPGSVMQNPDREIPIFNGDFGTDVGSCQDLASDLASVPVHSCEQAKAGYGFGILDLPTFCGCSGVELSNHCAFCGPEDMLNPGYDLHAFVGYDLTCEGAASLAASIRADSAMCNDRFHLLRKGCCQEHHRCHMCSDGTDEIAFPDKVMSFDDRSQNCADFRFNLGFLDQEACAELRSIFPVDFASYCGCWGTESPKECSLCGERIEVLYSRPRDGFNAEDNTCEEMEDLVEHVTDHRLCSELQASIGPKCCTDKDEAAHPGSIVVEDHTDKISSEFPAVHSQGTSDGFSQVVMLYHLSGMLVLPIILMDLVL